jgi:hypothetical protein
MKIVIALLFNINGIAFKLDKKAKRFEKKIYNNSI